MDSLGAGLLVILLLALAFLYLSMKVVAQGQAMVVFRMGQAKPEWVHGPGLHLVVPVIWRPVVVDMRERSIDVRDTASTADGASVATDLLVSWRILDAFRSVVNVASFATAVQGVATTTLRAIIGDMLLEDVVSKREQINELLRTKLDEVTDRWGGKITRFEIREITPQGDLANAADRQLSGGRTPEEILAEVVRRSPPTPGAGQ
jgi:regulator of protease activity HflC (stomatin/prohibitin superfamily)